MIKNCRTCAHRHGSFTFGKCLLSGFYCITERKFPTDCGRHFEQWQPRESFITRIKQFFIGNQNDLG